MNGGEIEDGLWRDGGSLTILNSIVAGNTAPGYGPDVAGSADGANDLIGGDPKLGPLADNGGPTRTMALLPGSPAIGAGGPVGELSSAISATATTLSFPDMPITGPVPGIFVIKIDGEQLLVTNVSGQNVTVVRGYNGTTPAAHSANAPIYLATDQRGTIALPHPTSGPIELTGVLPATRTVVELSMAESVYGQSITFTATVTSVSGSGTPTGTVTFKDGSTTLGAGTLSTAGGVTTATFATGSLAVGNHSITATYSGNTNLGKSTGSTVTETVAQAATGTTLVASINPSVFGQQVTFTATVGATAPGSGTPTGTVTFMDGTSTLGTAKVNGSGTATFGTGSLAIGGHTITATYPGDNNFNTSSSSTVTETVARAATGTALLASPNPSVLSQQVTFTATVGVTAPGSGTPTGTVTFTEGGTTLGTGTLSTAGGVTTATFATSSLAVGNHSITATYAGDGNFNTSTSQRGNRDGRRVRHRHDTSGFPQPVGLRSTGDVYGHGRRHRPGFRHAHGGRDLQGQRHDAGHGHVEHGGQRDDRHLRHRKACRRRPHDHRHLRRRQQLQHQHQ